MKTKTVSGIVTGSFEDVLNEAIEGLEREGMKVLDVKFSSTFGTPDKHYALILYRRDFEAQSIPYGIASALAMLEKERGKMFRIKAWIPAEVDPEDDTLYSREDAEKEKAQLEEMQPENRYEIEEVV